MSRYIFNKNNRWYISEVFDPSDSQLQEKASYYTLTDDVRGPYYAVGTSDSVSIGVSYVPVVEPAVADVTLGVVDSQGRFQALRFNGTQASNSGSAIQVQDYKTWNSTLPVPQPSGGSMDFYKCATVDTVNSTWTGYKAVLSGGVYSFKSTVTSGLTYGSGYIPTVGGIYDNGALVTVAKLFDGIPENGLIRYAPLSASAGEDELGNSLYTYGDVSFLTDSGVPCVECEGDWEYVEYSDWISGLSAYTLSVWMKKIDSSHSTYICFSGGDYGPNPWNEVWVLIRANGELYIGNGAAENPEVILASGDYSTGWHHVALSWNGTSMSLYVNGVSAGSATPQDYTMSSSTSLRLSVNTLYRWREGNSYGKYAALRLYNRVLTASEIAALAAEFTPTQA